MNSRRTQTSTERLRSRPAGADSAGRNTRPPRGTVETRLKTRRAQKNAAEAKRTKGAPAKNGPTKPKVKVKSAPTVKGNTSTATGRGNYQGPQGKTIKKAAAAKTKRKMAANLAKRAGGKLGGVVGAAATVASDRKKSETAARRKAYSKATKKPLKS